MINLHKIESAVITLTDSKGERLHVPLDSVESCAITLERDLIETTSGPIMGSSPQRWFEVSDQTLTLRIKGRTVKDED